MTDIREAAAKAAREWQPPHIGIDVTLLDIIRLGYQYGHMDGYEAAKAEADAERKLRDVVDEIVHPAHPYDKDCRCDLCRSYRIAHSWNGGSHD